MCTDRPVSPTKSAVFPLQVLGDRRYRVEKVDDNVATKTFITTLPVSPIRSAVFSLRFTELMITLRQRLSWPPLPVSPIGSAVFSLQFTKLMIT